jgi:hypothetical protein
LGRVEKNSNSHWKMAAKQGLQMLWLTALPRPDIRLPHQAHSRIITGEEARRWRMAMATRWMLPGASRAGFAGGGFE